MRGVTCAVDTLIQVSKIFFLISFAMFCPRLFLFYSMRPHHYHPKDSAFRLGLENINETTKKLFSLPHNNLRIALIANQSSVDQAGNRTVDLLLKKKLNITKLIMPIAVQKDDHRNIKEQSLDYATGISRVSLYNRFEQPDKRIFDDVDLIVFDVPDISLSYTTYIKTLHELLAVAAATKKTVVVLDRPNLSGTKMEGTLAGQQGKEVPIPLRSGMTTGELSNYINKAFFDSSVDLHVVPMCNYRRSYDEQKELLEHLAHAQLPTCLSSGCSFLGLLAQVAPFDVGIGTDRAFECLLLPESISFERQKWYELQIDLRNMGIESRFYRHFCSAKKEYYYGLRFSMQSIRELSTFSTLLSVLMFFKKSGLDFTFSACFDSTVGTPLVREVVQGSRSHELLKEKVNADLQMFFNKARDSFMYQPLPELVLI